ncbi:MAG: DNA ligase [Thermoanaerobacteraceae bacterium]|mgnify:CR=1 FL=1|nr:DNA ligase [Thermoanaerobacteraceae bacterium]
MVKPFVPFLPMEPKICREPFDDIKTAFQVKWDGVRILAHFKDGEVVLFNRKKRVRTDQYPEVAQALKTLINFNIILDGEMVALKDGKPNFPEILRRDFAVDAGTIKYLSNIIPVTYVVFDIVFYKEKDLTTYSFKFRDELLKTLLPSKDPIAVTDTVYNQGTALFSVVKEAELEGIVAKKLDSPYRIGQKNSDWLKIKNFRTLTAIIGGFIYEGREVRSLFLGVFQDHDFVYVGRAGSGLNHKTSLLLFDKLNKIKANHCPFTEPLKINKIKHICWVKPSIEVIVEYIEFTDDGLIRHPVIKEVMF